jgi:DNA-binding PadR family transcriptional regulator
MKYEKFMRENVKKRSRIFNTEKIILAILNDLTIGTLKTLYPHPYYHIFCHCNKSKSVYNALSRLEKKGLIKNYNNYNKEKQFILTQEGRKKSKHLAVLLKLADAFIGPPKSSWDGKWRAIFFDIPEKFRRHRDELRFNLKMLGFYQLQKSVWVHPLPIPKEFFKEFINPSLKRYTRIALLENIDQDKELRQFFFKKDKKSNGKKNSR